MIDEILKREDLPLSKPKFTLEEGLEYFDAHFPDYVILSHEWDWFVCEYEKWQDGESHRDPCLDIKCASRYSTNEHIYTASIWWENDALYGEI